MTEHVKRVCVRILEKEYQIACKPNEKNALLAAADELDARMRKVRNSGSIVGVDRIAVMVALNLCHELQQCREQSPETQPSSETLARLADKLERALQS